MTKHNFLNELERRLDNLSEADRKEIMQDYEEHFTFASKAGKSDEEVVASLGTPEKIASEMMTDYRIEPKDKTEGVRMVFAVGALIFFNLVFVFGLAMSIYVSIFGFIFSSLMFVATPVLLLIFSAVGLQPFTWFEFFSSLVLSGIGIFMSIAMYYITKWVFKLTSRYWELNLRIIRGGKG